MFPVLRQALRRLGRAPGFTLLTLLTVAIGVGANTAIFSVVDAVLLRPLPYPDSDRLITLIHRAPGLNLDELPSCPSMYLLYRDENRTFEASGVWDEGRSTVQLPDSAEQVDSIQVTHGVLDALGVPPYQGRWFTREDDSPSSPETVILSHAYWQRRYGPGRDALGDRLVVNGEPREVIGIMPAGFRIADRRADLYLPRRYEESEVRLGQFGMNGVARLREGVTMERASADIERMIPMLWERFAPPEGFDLGMFLSAGIEPNLRTLKQEVVGDVGAVLWVLMGAIGLVLLIACANVANLLLVRAEGRRHELTIRAALGAGWGRIARDLLVESLLLAAIGGALGLPLAHFALRILRSLEPAGFPRLEEIGLDLNALLFSIAVSLAAGLLFGAIPILRYSRPQTATALRAGGRTLSHSRDQHRARSALVVAQVALALVLLVSSGLMIRTFQALREVDPGFSKPESVQTFRAPISPAEAPEPDDLSRVQQRIAERLAALPGVESVGVSSSVTLDGWESWDPIFVEGRDYGAGEIPPLRRFRFIGPGYAETIGQPLLAGRTFDWEDVLERRPVVLVSENTARELFGDVASALGRRVRDNAADPWREIVGVLGDERADGLEQDAPTMVYWPVVTVYGENSRFSRSAVYTLRSQRAGLVAFSDEIRETVRAVNPNIPVANLQTLGEIHRRALGRTSFTLTLLGVAGGMALLLGLVGIYGVISYSVSQRTREIGVRMALGAERESVTRLFIGHGLALAAAGVGVGLVAAAAAMRLLATLLFGVEPVDPLTYGVAALGLAAATVTASYFPARRATQVDPASALRAD